MKTARTLATLLMVVAGLCSSVAVVAAENPVSGVSLATALRDANALAAGRPDLKVLRVEGVSMLPYFGPGAVIVMKTLPAEKLRTGMVVVYVNRFNETVAHRLVGGAADGWTAGGYNNRDADSTRVTADNLLGVVYATFHSNAAGDAGAVVAALGDATPVALAAPAR